MPALLPLLVLGVLAAAWRRRGAGSWSEALCGAAVVVGLTAALGAELLGVLGSLSRGGIAGLWLAAAAVAGFLWVRVRLDGTPSSPAPLSGGEGSAEGGSRALVAGIAAIALLVGLTAWASAPNTWDALTYHLPRVRHWIQGHSLANYPTSNLRQLTLAPGAEILLAHLRLLSGSDRLFNLVQWAAWIGAIAAASSIAARLGGGRPARLAAATFAATLPMAILQGSSSQNDLVVSFWLLVFAAFALRSLEAPGSRGTVALAAGSLALAVLTKATALLFALPFVVWLAAGLLRRRGLRAFGPLALGAAAVVAVNACAWARNVSLFGSPLGAAYGTVNESFAPALVISNAIRNAALHLTGPSDGWNRNVEAAVAGLHRVLGVGVEDRRATWPGARFRVPAGLSGAGAPGSEEAVFAMFHDGQAGNPVHLVLLGAAAVVILASRRRALRSAPALYLAALAAGALAFCLVLKWQPWNARLQLPLFLLGAPLFGVAIGDGLRPAWTERVCLLLLLVALPWTLVNATRPLLGAGSVLATPRLAQYFAEIPDSAPAFLGAARAVAELDCPRVGLEIRADDPEELLWVSLDAAVPGTRRVEQVNVRNRSQALSRKPPPAGFAPCAVVALESREGAAGEVAFSGSWAGGRIAVRRP